MSDDERRIRLHQALARQSVLHHRKREEQLETLLADALATVEKHCRCRACKHLHQLARELDHERTP